jgi:hypothetical protein
LRFRDERLTVVRLDFVLLNMLLHR